MSEEKRYPVVLMQSERLAARRDHAQRNPWGRTAELVGHIDAQQVRIAELEACLGDLRGAAIVAEPMISNERHSIHDIANARTALLAYCDDARVLLAGKEGD